MIKGTYENPNTHQREGRWYAHIATNVRTFRVVGKGATEEAAIAEARKLFHARGDAPLYHWLGPVAEEI